MPLEQIAFTLDLIGVCTGLVALSLAAWSVVMHRELFDSTFVASLYIVGIILVFISAEVRIEPSIPIIVTRAAIFFSVLFWEYVIFQQLRRYEEGTNLTLEEIRKAVSGNGDDGDGGS